MALDAKPSSSPATAACVPSASAVTTTTAVIPMRIPSTVSTARVRLRAMATRARRRAPRNRAIRVVSSGPPFEFQPIVLPPMGKVLDELVTQLALEKIEVNLFRGQSQDLGWGTVFGGQVLGQALSAAAQTTEPDRHVHSMHAYFLRPGDVSRPIVYEVDRIRDGGSFTTRRVVAIQSGAAIFNMAASFQKDEKGFEHQDAMPEVPPPE